MVKKSRWIWLFFNNTSKKGDNVKVSKNYNLKSVLPDLAMEWHPKKNGSLRPDQVTPYTNKKVWWKCINNHEWQASIGSRAKGTNCPYCYGRYPSSEYNLEVINPGLAKEWHPTRNGKLTPREVTPGTDRRVWWQCEKGHEWEANICHRKKTGCPDCAMEKVKNKKRGSVSLLEVRPDLAEQWHPAKNGELTPDKISYGSRTKVWWRCDEGHSWKASPKKRVSGTGCPYCTGHRVSKENNLQVVHPDIAAQWHPTKNGKLTPRKVTPGSKKKVWWQCEKGHEWEAAVLNRHHGNGCPYCSGKRATAENNLAAVNPGLASQWHPTKNGEFTPDKVKPFSSLKVWWRCIEGHEWLARVGHRSRGRGCPVCFKTHGDLKRKN
jgi:hypothetical protein